MTEEEWLTFTLVSNALRQLPSVISASDRKLRLFGCACSRTVENWLLEEGVHSIEVSELYADGLSTKEELSAARESAKIPYMAGGNAEYGRDVVTRLAHQASVMVAWGRTEALRAVSQLIDQLLHVRRYAGGNTHNLEFSVILRDIFGNPFRPIALDPRWLTSNVVDLARTIYEERAFDRLPILADALMDAGCDSDDIIAHCRGNGPHVHGCWVVDLLLGKE